MCFVHVSFECENKVSGQPEGIGSFIEKGTAMADSRLRSSCCLRNKSRRRKSFTVLRSYSTSTEVLKHLRVSSQTPPRSEQLCRTEETYSTSYMSWMRDIYVHIYIYVHMHVPLRYSFLCKRLKGFSDLLPDNEHFCSYFMNETSPKGSAEHYHFISRQIFRIYN